MKSFAERMVKRMRARTAEFSTNSKAPAVQIEPPRRVVIIFFSHQVVPMGVRNGRHPKFVSMTGRRCHYVS